MDRQLIEIRDSQRVEFHWRNRLIHSGPATSCHTVAVIKAIRPDLDRDGITEYNVNRRVDNSFPPAFRIWCDRTVQQAATPTTK